MEFFLQSTLAVGYISLGFLIGASWREHVHAMRAAPEPPPQDPPVPPDDPRRDPNWCHTHGQMYPCRGCEGR